MAHASVASLTRTIESLLTFNSPMQSLICDHREEFCALHEKVSSLEVFLKNFEKNNVFGEMTDFEVEVKEAANDVEYTIQLRLAETVLGENKSQKKKARRRFRQSLQQVAGDIDRVWKESAKIQDKGKQVPKESTNDILNVKNNMVGRDDQREQLLDDLTRSYFGELKVIPIVGMGGIGKTTLAKEVYNHVSIIYHFDVRAWATVSQKHNVKEILLSLLHSTKGDKFCTGSEAELADMLQKSLKGKRYLIVLDDMWSSEVWDDVRLCFPSENNAGSRILLTTRSNEVACHAGTENLSTQIDFMDQDESWNLFKSAAFSNEAVPSEFETIGKQIADECHGLPLTIVVVAGLLKSKRTIEDWESVSKDVTSFVTNDPDEQCSHILGLSFNHLTSDLKACLLYFGICPEDAEIPVKYLMRLWMAEGFLNLESDLEGEAEKCLQELVDRCLVLVCKKNRDGTKIRSCKVHDLIHDLCLREVLRENVFIMNEIVFEKSDAYHVSSECQSLSSLRMKPFKRSTDDEISDSRYELYRALLFPGHHQLTDDNNNNLLKRTRSIFFAGSSPSTFILKSDLIHFKLLKILDLGDIEIDVFPVQILSLIWLRYLALLRRWKLDIPLEICRLWNLQIFIIEGSHIQEFLLHTTIPEQIWGLAQLRHLELQRFYLPNLPNGSVNKGRRLDFPNIQTISYLSPCCCTKEVILGIQNVKKLGIGGDVDDFKSIQESGHLNNLVHLQKLETLSLKLFSLESISISPVTIPSAKAFPATLKKLKLKSTYLSWSYLDIIAELPNLEVLKLMFNACDGEEWCPTVMGFNRLKLLLIEGNHLKYWKATNDNFPVLERLLLSYCHHLKEIPIEFADIHSLQLIEVDFCLPELGESAIRIQQEQEDLGNNPVDVRIIDPCKYIYRVFMKVTLCFSFTQKLFRFARYYFTIILTKFLSSFGTLV
ncbi:hypothetical protein T459_24467 [Capsicum annuum]|uniref:Uncharacterized protein n=1 Tax=Capsicum annuum TaxID=4072 RepID=A0A2G2YVB2_CAPAN|nr:hypothetical protein T459_24467 [Capsicum annuum]